MMSEVETKGFASSVEELAKRLNGRVIARVDGEQWSYVIIENENAVVVVKHSPRSKTLFLRGLIAIPHVDLNKLVRSLEPIAKESTKKILQRIAEKYGIEVNIK